MKKEEEALVCKNLQKNCKKWLWSLQPLLILFIHSFFYTLQRTHASTQDVSKTNCWSSSSNNTVSQKNMTCYLLSVRYLF